MTIANVFGRLSSHSSKTGTVGQNNLLSSISILQISVEAHHQVPCEQHSMGRPIANGCPYRPRPKTDRQKSSKTDKFTCLARTPCLKDFGFESPNSVLDRLNQVGMKERDRGRSFSIQMMLVLVVSVTIWRKMIGREIQNQKAHSVVSHEQEKWFFNQLFGFLDIGFNGILWFKENWNSALIQWLAFCRTIDGGSPIGKENIWENGVSECVTVVGLGDNQPKLEWFR
jgi:hypothetical protein